MRLSTLGGSDRALDTVASDFRYNRLDLVPVHETNSDTLKINRCSNRILEIFLIFFTWLIYYKNNMQLIESYIAKIWNRIVEINHYIYVLHDYILYGKIWNFSRWEENKNTYKQWCDTVRVKKISYSFLEIWMRSCFEAFPVNGNFTRSRGSESWEIRLNLLFPGCIEHNGDRVPVAISGYLI